MADIAVGLYTGNPMALVNFVGLMMNVVFDVIKWDDFWDREPPTAEELEDAKYNYHENILYLE